MTIIAKLVTTDTTLKMVRFSPLIQLNIGHIKNYLQDLKFMSQLFLNSVPFLSNVMKFELKGDYTGMK